MALDRRTLCARVVALVAGERLQLFVDRHDVHVQVTPIRTPENDHNYKNVN